MSISQEIRKAAVDMRVVYLSEIYVQMMIVVVGDSYIYWDSDETTRRTFALLFAEFISDKD
jgi:hypothetical protein